MVCVLLIVINGILGFLLTRQSAGNMKDQIQARMLDITKTAASMIDGDALAKIRAEDKGSSDYEKVQSILTHFQDNIKLEYIYCVRDKGDGTFVFTIDPTVEDPAEFGQPVVYTEALYQASLGTSAVDEEPYSDEWGRFYSSYSPVFDSSGKVAGIVAVDFSAEWYEREIYGLIWTTVIIIVAAFIFSVFIAIIISSGYRTSFSRVFSQMHDLSDGIETLIHEVSQETGSSAGEGTKYVDNVIGDEIDALGDSIREMQNRLGEQISIIRAQAYIDGLTGLNNRAAYEDAVKRLEESIAEGNAEFTVAVFDINQLKMINDDYGHDNGDCVITKVAGLIGHIFGRENLYRTGGDEFVALLDDGDPAESIVRLTNLLEETCENTEKLKKHNIKISVSTGYATYDKTRDSGFKDTFGRADKAMYLNKKAFYENHEDRRRANYKG